MHNTTPQVFLLARPSLNWDGVREYLEAVNGMAHYSRMLDGYQGDQHGSKLVELASRGCYRSWEPGLNKNVTRVRTDRREHLGNVLKSAHGSVTEHANYTFAAVNVSRVCTHELVRHRAGWAFSQESMRFVRLDDIGFAEPDIFPDTPEGHALLAHSRQLLHQMEQFQLEAARVNQLDVPMEDGGPKFEEKKRVTSAMRRYAPDGLSTVIVFTANVRSLRWVCQQRTEPAAEVEIRNLFDQVSRIMQVEEPDLWQDFEVTDEGAWVPAHRKV